MNAIMKYFASTDLEKSGTSVGNVLEIINLANYRTYYDVFHFMFYVLHPLIFNLIIVSKIKLQWSCLLAFSYPFCKQFKLS